MSGRVGIKRGISMDLSVLAGNARLKRLLAERLSGRGLSHAYMISGPVGSGRHTLARALAASMVCTAPHDQRPCNSCPSCKKVAANIHPDVLVTAGEDEGKPISVSQIRGLRTDAHIRPNEGERKIYLLEGADQMNASAQNAMLKLLEEGPAYAVFLLLCEQSSGLLATVRSRCEALALTPVPPAECKAWLREHFPKADQVQLEQAVAHCQGILGRAVWQLAGGDEATQATTVQVRQLAEAMELGSEMQLFEQAMLLEKLGREELIRLLDGLEGELGNRILKSVHKRRLLQGVELVRTLRAAARQNANPGQLAGWLCAGLFFVPENSGVDIGRG